MRLRADPHRSQITKVCESKVGLREQALFDLYLNLCPGQGSRTIRTEEVLLVGLAALQPHTRRAGAS